MFSLIFWACSPREKKLFFERKFWWFFLTMYVNILQLQVSKYILNSLIVFFAVSLQVLVWYKLPVTFGPQWHQLPSGHSEGKSFPCFRRQSDILCNQLECPEQKIPKSLVLRQMLQSCFMLLCSWTSVNNIRIIRQIVKFSLIMYWCYRSLQNHVKM